MFIVADLKNPKLRRSDMTIDTRTLVILVYFRCLARPYAGWFKTSLHAASLEEISQVI